MFSWLSTLKDLFSAILAPIPAYERHLSALAMVGGFALDNYTFGRIDRPAANIVFCAYLALAAGTIALLHLLQSLTDRRKAAEEARATALRDRSLAAAAARRPFPVVLTKPRQPPVHIEPKFDAGFEPPAPPLEKETAPEEAAPPAAEAQTAHGHDVPKGERWRVWLPFITQFALGGLWSAFLVFYSRSASFSTAWPFLLILVTALVGNELMRKYHARLVFTTLLLFFALYSYAIFLIPIFTHSIGRLTFITSGVAAALVFLLFLRLLRLFGRERYRRSRLALLGGFIGILAAMNGLYFLNLLPPLPLALEDAGVYHAVKRSGAVYQAVTEEQPWQARFGLEKPVYHVAPGERLSVYAAVFAPINLTTRVTHRWQWYSAKRQRWLTLSQVSFAIAGGRDGGYRAYSIKSKPKPGDWRVDIDTVDGRRIGRIAFKVEGVAAPVATVNKTIQ